MHSVIAFLTSEYSIHLLILVALYSIVAQSFNLVFGSAWLLNLAHIASYAIGAYATALLATDHGWSFLPCILASTILCGLFAFSVAAISVRLTMDYFAIGTLAFSALITALLINWKSLTRGVLGIPGIPRPELFGIDFTANRNFLSLIAVTAILVQVVYYILMRGGFGRALRAQGEFEQGAQVLGYSVRRLRLLAFVISSATVGIAGAYFAYYLSFIDPSSFALSEMIFVLSIVVIGRPGSFIGCLAATVFLVLLPEPLRFIDMDSSILGPMRQLLYAVIFFAVVLWRRDTLFPVERRI